MIRTSISGLVLGSLLFSSALSAQVANGQGSVVDVRDYHDAFAAPVPFGPGETMRYNLKVGFFSVGEGVLSVSQVDSVRGNPAYHIRMDLDGTLLSARIDNTWESWLDIYTLSSHRFIQDFDELNKTRYRYYDFFPQEGVFREVNNPDPQPLASSLPLDDISFFFYARAIPLEVGKTYRLNRYFKDDGNPVILNVLRKETIEVPAGTFNTIVVEPIIRSSGLFGDGGEAELYFTDDDRRLLVHLKSKIPVLGSLTLHLENIEEGHRIWDNAEDHEPARRGQKHPTPAGQTSGGVF